MSNACMSVEDDALHIEQPTKPDSSSLFPNSAVDGRVPSNFSCEEVTSHCLLHHAGAISISSSPCFYELDTRLGC